MTLALEINDAGLILARDGQIVAEEPGCAMLDGRSVETGSAALKRARLKPLFAETRYWQDLGTAALPRPMPAAATYADVAYAQLAALADGIPADARDTLLAVPGSYGREQLAVLLGVAREAGLEVVGLVDAGRAAAALEPVPESVLQLELATHQSVMLLEQVTPAAVADLDRRLGRTYEVGEQHGREHPIRRADLALAGQELA